MINKIVLVVSFILNFCLLGQVTTIPEVTNQTFSLPYEEKKSEESKLQENKTDEEKKQKNVIKETVTIKTDDAWLLKGDFYKVNYDENFKMLGKAILLLHMLPSDRNSYGLLIPNLTAMGFNILNLDWRGHGESIYKDEKCPKGGTPTTAACPPKKPMSYADFTNADYKNAIKDVEAAIKFLQDKGAKIEDIGIIGASIGANYAINFAAFNTKLSFIVLLSPGLEYHDVAILDSFKSLAKTNVKIFLYSSQEDDYSSKTCKKLEEEFKKEKDAKIENLIVINKEFAGHGTHMLGFIKDDLLNNLKQFIFVGNSELQLPKNAESKLPIQNKSKQK